MRASSTVATLVAKFSTSLALASALVSGPYLPADVQDVAQAILSMKAFDEVFRPEGGMPGTLYVTGLPLSVSLRKQGRKVVVLSQSDALKHGENVLVFSKVDIGPSHASVTIDHRGKALAWVVELSKSASRWRVVRSTLLQE